jgi:hypothetical protein
MYLYSDSQIGRTSPKLEKKFMVSNLEISGDLLDSRPGVVMSANAAQTNKEPNVPRKTSCIRLCQICDEIWRPITIANLIGNKLTLSLIAFSTLRLLLLIFFHSGFIYAKLLGGSRSEI